MRFPVRWAAAAAVAITLAALCCAAPAGAQGYTTPVSNPQALQGTYRDANFPRRVSHPGRGFSLAAAVAAQNRAPARRAPESASPRGRETRIFQVLPYNANVPVLTVPDDMFPGSVPPNMDAGTYNVRATGILPATGISPTTGARPVAVPALPAP